MMRLLKAARQYLTLSYRFASKWTVRNSFAIRINLIFLVGEVESTKKPTGFHGPLPFVLGSPKVSLRLLQGWPPECSHASSTLNKMDFTVCLLIPQLIVESRKFILFILTETWNKPIPFLFVTQTPHLCQRFPTASRCR